MNTNTVPSTAQMKAALANIAPRKAVSSNKADAIADAIAVGVAGTVTGIANAGAGTVNFLDRVATGYKFKRALDTGKLVIPGAATRAPRKSRAKAK
jgi:hypothetical protein